MPTGPNPYFAGYGTSPAFAQIGQSLGKALFGDPVARDKALEQQARMANYQAAAREADAHAGLYTQQGEGQGIQNGGARALPGSIAEAIASMGGMPTAPSAPLPTAGLGGGYAPAALPGAAPANPDGDIVVNGHNRQDTGPAFAHLLGAAAQAQGDKVDPSKLAAMIGAMYGTDSEARRGMVGTGHTPGPEFALTSERADDIAQQAQQAKYSLGTAIAGINHASDIPVANIGAGARIGAAKIGAGASVAVGAGHDRTDITTTGMKIDAPAKPGGIKPISPSVNRMLLAEADRRLGKTYVTGTDGKPAVGNEGLSIKPEARTMFDRLAASNYQHNGGNPAAAVDDAYRTMSGQGRAKRQAGNAAPKAAAGYVDGQTASNGQGGKLTYSAKLNKWQ